MPRRSDALVWIGAVRLHLRKLEWVVFDPAGIASGSQSLPGPFVRCNNLLKDKTVEVGEFLRWAELCDC